MLLKAIKGHLPHVAQNMINLLIEWRGVGPALEGSALVNTRRKALLSSVGFRKPMTSRSSRGSPCDSCKLRVDRPFRFI